MRAQVGVGALNGHPGCIDGPGNVQIVGVGQRVLDGHLLAPPNDDAQLVLDGRRRLDVDQRVLFGIFRRKYIDPELQLALWGRRGGCAEGAMFDGFQRHRAPLLGEPTVLQINVLYGQRAPATS